MDDWGLSWPIAMLKLLPLGSPGALLSVSNDRKGICGALTGGAVSASVVLRPIGLGSGVFSTSALVDEDPLSLACLRDSSSFSLRHSAVVSFSRLAIDSNMVLHRGQLKA